MKKKQIFGVLCGIALVIGGIVLSETMQQDALSPAGIRTVGVLLAFLVMLVTEALPVIVTSLLFCALMPMLGVTQNLSGALSGFAQPIVFFTLASFGIAAAITNIPLSKRVLRALLSKFGGNIGSVLLAMMVCCALVSSIVSNVPTCAIFMALSLDFIELYKDEDDKRRTGRVFMIGIPVASMIGGMMTPAGSSVNLLAIAQFEMHTGMTISFVQWMIAGVPLAIVMIPLAWFLMVKVYKPAPATKQSIDAFVGGLNIPEKMDSQEKKVIIIVLAMISLWICSSWVPKINVMEVALLGCVVMFLPGVRVLDIKTFVYENSWDAFFLVGTVLSISGAMVTNGVSSLLAESVPAVTTSPLGLIAFTAVFIFAALVVIPVATSLIPIMAAPLIAIAAAAHVPAALIMMTAALCACNCYLLPLDTVTLITYSKGYYSMTDMAKSTIFLQLAMVMLCVLYLPVCGKIFGLL